MALLEPRTHSRPYKLMVDDFYRLDLPSDKRYELLEGVIYQMPAMGPRHAATVERVASYVRAQIAGVQVREEKLIYWGKNDLPQPDLAVVKSADYSRQHPQPEDICLLVEVADTTLAHDRRKLADYAKAGVQEVWILNLEEYQIEVYLEPKGGKYRTQHLYEPGDPIIPYAFAEIALEIAW
ncbi:MAG: Uma2 family endonuclease [Thermaceae bacterium]|nr:Uma2 family endonuclease [Thermaceae bacterium]